MIFAGRLDVLDQAMIEAIEDEPERRGMTLRRCASR